MLTNEKKESLSLALSTTPIGEEIFRLGNTFKTFACALKSEHVDEYRQEMAELAESSGNDCNDFLNDLTVFLANCGVTVESLKGAEKI